MFSGKKNKIYNQSIAYRHMFRLSSLAGTTGQALTYPLDRARAVMAVTKVGEFRNIFHVFSTIYHREGILGK